MSRSRSIALVDVGGLMVRARPSAFAASLALWLVAITVGYVVLNLSPLEAFVGGTLVVVAHWFGEIIHQLGHALAARSTGHPMIGIRLWGLLSSSIYPRGEGKLPASVHIRRALGGPIMSLFITILAAAILLMARPVGGMFWGVALFFFLDNLLVFTLGSLLPLGFTDGSTLLEWWGKR
jgi:Zn-dependent protease